MADILSNFVDIDGKATHNDSSKCLMRVLVNHVVLDRGEEIVTIFCGYWVSAREKMEEC